MSAQASQQRLVLIPGLGADARLFGPQRAAFPRAETPAWLEWRRGEALPDYAARLAATVDTGEPYFLAGASLGGMLSLEMAPVLRPAPRAVFLLGSCRSGRAVADLPRWFERCTRPAPDGAVDAVRPLCRPFIARTFRGLTPDQRRLVATMMAETPLSFLRNASRAIFAWELDGAPAAPTHHIHGARDGVILLRRVKADVVLPGAAHMLTLSHAAEVNRFIAARIEA